MISTGHVTRLAGKGGNASGSRGLRERVEKIHSQAKAACQCHSLRQFFSPRSRLFVSLRPLFLKTHQFKARDVLLSCSADQELGCTCTWSRRHFAPKDKMPQGHFAPRHFVLHLHMHLQQSKNVIKQVWAEGFNSDKSACEWWVFVKYKTRWSLYQLSTISDNHLASMWVMREVSWSKLVLELARRRHTTYNI